MRPPARDPVWIPADSPPVFPDPREFEPHGLVAGGGDLSSRRLLAAYRAGIFPWYDDPPILWWSPDPRTVLKREDLHVSRSLRRTLRQGVFRVSLNRALDRVLDGCSSRSEGTWLSIEMRDAYLELHALGHIRSYEVWSDDQLVGGLYGVLIGGLFAAESMFHRRSNASKIALVASVTHLFAQGVRLYDVQFMTAHLGRMGAREVRRDDYLRELERALAVHPSPPLIPPPASPSGPLADDADLLPWVETQLSSSRATMLKSPANGH